MWTGTGTNTGLIKRTVHCADDSIISVIDVVSLSLLIVIKTHSVTSHQIDKEEKQNTVNMHVIIITAPFNLKRVSTASVRAGKCWQKTSFCVTNTEDKSSPLCPWRHPPEWCHAESNMMSPVWTCFTGHNCNLGYMFCEASERREESVSPQQTWWERWIIKSSIFAHLSHSYPQVWMK